MITDWSLSHYGRVTETRLKENIFLTDPKEVRTDA